MPPSCALLGRFAIGARVSLLRQHSANTNCQRVLVLALFLGFNGIRQVATTTQEQATHVVTRPTALNVTVERETCMICMSAAHILLNALMR